MSTRARQQLACALIASAASLAAAQSTPPSASPADIAPGTGIIVGQVIEAGSGRGVPGALVTLTTANAAGMTASSGPPSSHGVVLSTADGRFLFRDLRQGTYHVHAMKSGYLNGSHGARRPAGGSAPIELDDGEQATDVSVPLFRWGTITGSVVDDGGEPLVGVEVTVLRRSLVGGRRQFIAGMAASTDDRGFYRIPGLVPGDYVVAVVAASSSVPIAVAETYRDAMNANDPERLPLMRRMSEAGVMMVVPGSPMALQTGTHLQTFRGPTPPPAADETRLMMYPTTFYPAVRSASEATLIALRSGEERSGIDFDLRPVRTTRVSGTVSGPDGPVAYVGLRLESGADDVVLDQQPTTVTDASGAFAFPAVATGQYNLRIVQIPRPSFPGSAATIIQSGNTTISYSGPGPPTAPPPIPSEPTLWATVPLSVGNAPISGLSIALQTGSRVRGRVEFDGTAERPEPSQMQRLALTLEPVTGRIDFRSSPMTRVEPNGEFATGGVVGGQYFVRVMFAPAGWYFKEARYEGVDLADTPISLEGRDLNGVTIVFTDRPTELAGSVRGSQGPDGDATVLIFPADEEAWTITGLNPRRMRSVRASKTGTYKILGLPAGEYYVVAVPDETATDWQDPRILASLARDATRVRLDDRQRKTQDLRTQQRR